MTDLPDVIVDRRDIQRNFDAVNKQIQAGALATLLATSFVAPSDPLAVKLFAARLSLLNPTPTINTALGVTGVARTGVGVYVITHDACTGLGILMCSVTAQGNTGGGAQANVAPLTATTTQIDTHNAAGALIDGEVVMLVGVG